MLSAFGARDIPIRPAVDLEAATPESIAAAELDALKREHAEYQRMAEGRFSAMDTATLRDKRGAEHWTARAAAVAEQIAQRQEAAA